jgi:hypothetical protein
LSQQFIFDGSTASVLVTVLDEVHDKEYKGIFKFACLLQAMDLVDIDALYRELIGPRPQDADRAADRIAFSLAHLRYRVLDAPEWWKADPRGRTLVPGGHCDRNVVVEVFNIAVQAEERYRSRLKKEVTDAKRKLEQRLDDGTLARELDVDAGGPPEAEPVADDRAESLLP